MTQKEALKKAQARFGKDAIAIVSADEFKVPDASGKIPAPVVRYIVGFEENGIPTYAGVGHSWQEACEKAQI
jgi:hypothetical protein